MLPRALVYVPQWVHGVSYDETVRCVEGREDFADCVYIFKTVFTMNHDSPSGHVSPADTRVEVGQQYDTLSFRYCLNYITESAVEIFLVCGIQGRGMGAYEVQGPGTLYHAPITYDSRVYGHQHRLQLAERLVEYCETDAMLSRALTFVSGPEERVVFFLSDPQSANLVSESAAMSIPQCLSSESTKAVFLSGLSLSACGRSTPRPSICINPLRHLARRSEREVF